MEICRAEHPWTRRSAVCLEDGRILIREGERLLSTLRLFGAEFQEQTSWWGVEVRLGFSPGGDWLAVSYGLGHVYLAEPETGQAAARFRLFDEVRYEDESYQDIDTYCYYNEHTRLDFSPSGRWLAVRVRGDFDPQEEDGRREHFTPQYFRSVSVIDMERRTLVFTRSFEDEHPGYENLAALAFQPAEELLAVGAPGGRFRLLSLPEGETAGEFSSLIWVPDPLGVRHRDLIRFVDDDTLVYLSGERTASRLRRETDGLWRPDGVLSPEEGRQIMGEEFLLCCP